MELAEAPSEAPCPEAWGGAAESIADMGIEKEEEDRKLSRHRRIAGHHLTTGPILSVGRLEKGDRVAER